MNIVIKNKINQNGDLCICIIDNMYPQNDDEIHLTNEPYYKSWVYFKK